MVLRRSTFLASDLVSLAPRSDPHCADKDPCNGYGNSLHGMAPLSVDPKGLVSARFAIFHFKHTTMQILLIGEIQRGA